MAPLMRVLQTAVHHVYRRASVPVTANNSKYHPGGMTIAPEKINNKALFALFAILGAALALASIWFFFWAKNGGFHKGENDWEDYKSSVLRRKGNDGKTLSGATHSTDLGGGSIVGRHADGLSSWGGSRTSASPSEEDLYNEKLRRQDRARDGRQKKTNKASPARKTYEAVNSKNLAKQASSQPPSRWKRAALLNSQKENERCRQKTAEIRQVQPSGSYHTPTGANKPDTGRGEKLHDPDMRAYRHERPARVGGLNRPADGILGQTYSASPSASTYTSPQPTPPRHSASSTGPKRSSHDPHRSKPKYRAPAHQSDYTAPLDFDERDDIAGTKSYHHPIPGLSAAGAGIGTRGAPAGVGTGGFRRGRHAPGGGLDGFSESNGSAFS